MKLAIGFLMGSIVFFNHHAALLAQNSKEDIGTMLDQGQEVVDNQKLTANMHDLLHQHGLLGGVVNIVHNEEAEKYYAWKNFKTKLEIIAVVASCIGALYLFYRYGPTGDGGWFPGRGSESRSDDYDAPTSKGSKATLRNGKETVAKKKRGKRGKLVDVTQPLHLVYRFDQRLEKEIGQQIEYAESIGLEPADIEFDDPEIKQPLDDRKFNEKIAEQIEYARSIGLEPAEDI